jgi:hypothetical protein
VKVDVMKVEMVNQLEMRLNEMMAEMKIEIVDSKIEMVI